MTIYLCYIKFATAKYLILFLHICKYGWTKTAFSVSLLMTLCKNAQQPKHTECWMVRFILFCKMSTKAFLKGVSYRLKGRNASGLFPLTFKQIQWLCINIALFFFKNNSSLYACEFIVKYESSLNCLDVLF